MIFYLSLESSEILVRENEAPLVALMACHSILVFSALCGKADSMMDENLVFWLKRIWGLVSVSY